MNVSTAHYHTLQQERDRLLKEARGILNKADAEKRDLTPAEERQVDEMNAQLKDVTGELQKRHDEVVSGQDRTTPEGYWDGARYGALTQHMPIEGQEPDTPRSEARALAPDESVRSYLQKRGMLRDADAYRGLTVGGYLRAMVLGPSTEIERRALAEGTDSTGGYTVPDILSAQMIDRLRAASVAMRAGARTFPLESDKTSVARLENDPVPSWRAENAAVAESDPTFSSVIFQPKSLAVLVKVSRELLEDSVNIESALETALSQAMAGEVDRVVLLGSGTGNEPRGIKNVAGVAVVNMGTNGAALTNYVPLLDARAALLNANANEPTAYVMAPRTDTDIAKLADTTGQPLRRPTAIENVRFLRTTRIPTDEVHGTATNASRIITGDFAQCLVGVRTALRIEVLRERYADFLQYAFLAWLRMDVALAHAESFAQVEGIIPTP